MKQVTQNKKNNIALIDGQNLHLSTIVKPFQVDAMNRIEIVPIKV